VDASAARVRTPIRGTALRGCAVTVHGAISMLRVSVMINPTALHHRIVFSFNCPHTHRLLAM
jgi:hypothetical protein